MRKPRRRASLEERFWKHVTPLGPDDCWLWQGSTFHYKNTGLPSYGRMSKGGRGEGHLKAHRVSWILHYGPLPDDVMVLHRCAVKLCVNPNHLYPGNNAANMLDMYMVRPELKRNGTRNGMSKLSEGEVLEILMSEASYSELGREYGVSKDAIRDIRIGKTWKHVHT